MVQISRSDLANRESLRITVEELHGCSAVFKEDVAVTETYEGETVWDGVVHTFKLSGHPTASACYAWSSPVEDSDRRQFYAVLQVPPIASAPDAVRAAIVQDSRQAGLSDLFDRPWNGA